MHDALSSIGFGTRTAEPEWSDRTMNRNVLYLIIGALVVATAVFGYQLYQERQKTRGVQINIGERGLSIEKK